jgi:uncharacterized protein involved in tolerance to divalent cations
MWLFLCSCQPGLAEEITQSLLEKRLFSCIYAISGIKKVLYRHQNILVQEETLLTIETPLANPEDVFEALTNLYPAKVSQVFGLNMFLGYEPYWERVRREVELSPDWDQPVTLETSFHRSMEILFCSCPKENAEQIAREIVRNHKPTYVYILPGMWVRSIESNHQLSERDDVSLFITYQKGWGYEIRETLSSLHPSKLEKFAIEVLEGYRPDWEWPEGEEVPTSPYVQDDGSFF